MQVIFQYATIYLYNIICGFVRIPEITTKCGESHKRCLSLHNQIISYLFLNFKVPYLLTLYLMLLFFIWLHAYQELLQLQFKNKLYIFSPDFLGLLGW